jgi:hypothetical protein
MSRNITRKLARKPLRQTTGVRQGVILLVVISMLVLFSLVGLAFVIYAEGQANTSRIWREGESIQQPDMDPELLLSYFLGQLIYDTDNPLSALRGHGMVRNMYGTPGSTIPFNGTGRLHTAAPDSYYSVDYTNYSGGAPRDPNAPGTGSPNPPYTYPDFNHMYLAAQRASDGKILVPSYSRTGPSGTISLRPSTTYHTGFGALANASGDVKNLADSAGFGSGPFDSIWIDLGFPVMTAPDGRQFKPLFAPLILDLDGRLNVNVHGNIRGGTFQAGGGESPAQGFNLSDQGLGPWEVDASKVITATDGYVPNTSGPHQESRRLFIGNMDNNYNQTLRGRYDIMNTPTNGPWGLDSHRLPDRYAITGPFYSPINGDANYQVMGTALPGFGMGGAPTPPTSCFPQYNNNADGWNSGGPGRNHPMLYNFFMPTMSYYNVLTRGRAFSALNMRSLLLYGDTGSPSEPSEIFQICPRSFGDPTNGPKARRQVTTHAFDIDQPGVTPWLWLPPGVPNLQLQAGAPYPTGQPITTPPPAGTSPPGSEFSPTMQAMVAGMGRIHVNRDLPKGALPWYNSMGVAGEPPGLKGLSNGRITDINQAQKAILARQQYASELFNYFQNLTGAASPATATPGTPEFDALRWLAQLSVNIVDQIDNDENMTPFPWYQPNPNDPKSWQWVYGTEISRLVINEVYSEIANDPTDPNLPAPGTPPNANNMKKASLDYKVNFWVELHNPFYNNSVPGGQGGYTPVLDGGNARLMVPASGNNQAYAVYKVTITTQNQNMRANSNVRGDPDRDPVTNKYTTIKAEVKDYTPETAGTQTAPTPLQPPPTWIPSANTQYVAPSSGATKGANGNNQGYFLLGPKVYFPGTILDNKDPNFVPLNPMDGGFQLAQVPVPLATLCVKDSGGQPGQQRNAMLYEPGLINQKSDPGQFAQNTKHTVLLRRLCCPGLPPNPTPDSANYNPALPVNPYVTVDYMENIPVNDGVIIDSNGQHQNTPMASRYSIGKNQPYAGDNRNPQPNMSQVKQQQPVSPVMPPNPKSGQPQSQPQHTFFSVNVQNTDATGKELPDPANAGQGMRWPFDWLTFIDRPLISPVELLQTSGFKPHELTQQFMTGGTDPNSGKPQQKFTHMAPWFDPNARIYRVMEYMNATSPMQWVPVGGRTTGQVNINSIWDPEVFRALAGCTPCNFFATTDVDGWYTKMVQTRSPKGAPAIGDQPFVGLASGNIDATIYRSDPADANPNPAARRRMFEPTTLNPNANGHPYIKYEFLKKLFNNVKTRSNVFAVWVTVGFFEVGPPKVAGGPATLGQEINFSTNRHIRHRMFAIIDRSSATIRIDPVTSQPSPGQVGPSPFFIPALSPVPPPAAPGQPQQLLVDVPAISGTYEGINWQITAGQKLVIDTGLNQEVVTVLAARAVQAGDQPANQGPYVIQATFSKPHTNRFAISNAMLGNAGPQPRFDLRQPNAQLLIRFFQILE